MIAFVAWFYKQDPRLVAEWKGEDLILWYNEGMKLYEEQIKINKQTGGCAWR